MTQVVESKKSGITERIERLDQLANEVAELRSKKENIEERRQERIQKNNAFGEVKSAIVDVEKTFNVLQRAVALADQLNAQVPRSDIERILEEYGVQLCTFESEEYDDFHDVNEINSLRKDFEEFQKTLDDQKSIVKGNLKTVATSKLEEVNTRETILRIPDIGTEADSEAVQIYKHKMEAIARGQIVDTTELEDAKNNYESVDIDIDTITDQYKLSDEAGEMLLRFLRNETVTLAQVDDGVLDELKRLEEFSGRLTIQF